MCTKLLTIFVIAINLSCTLNVLNANEVHNCFTENDAYVCKLGIKSPYRFVANYDDSPLFYAGCKEKKIWLIIRHGTRYPGGKNLKLILDNINYLKNNIIDQFHNGNSKLEPNLVNKIENWNLDFNESYSKILAEEGENEMIDLAERMQNRFPTIFTEIYDNETYRFKYTKTQRTEKSAQFFALGLFGQLCSQDVNYLEPEDQDPILRFYKRCNRWKTKVYKNTDTYTERDLFINSDNFKNMLNEMSDSLGFDVSYENATVLHSMCAFETAWCRDKTSPWCEIFSYDQMKIFEFKEDLHYYLANGYGNALNYEQSCPAVINMFNFLESDNKTLVSAYFAHSGTILKLLPMFGIGKDKNGLNHKSFSLSEDSRNWRLSLFDTFGSNLAFVLYDCKLQGKSILIMHQERPVHIPGCPPHMPCPISILKRLFPDQDDECQFEEMCSLNDD